MEKNYKALKFQKIIVSTIFAVFVLHSVFAQESIRGKVIDEDSKKGIAGALVLIKGGNIRATTNEDGSFVLKTSQQPPFILKVLVLGYQSTEVKINTTDSDIKIELQSQYVVGNEIVVLASPIPERVLESPVSIELISAKDVQNSASTSFYDGLPNLKGVDQSVQSFTFKSLNARGFGANGNVRFNQFIDGMDNQAPGLNFSVGNVAGISDLDLESAELLSGSSSAIYGAGGINGTLLLKSKDPFRYQGLSMQFKTGVNHVDGRQQPMQDWNDIQFRYAKAWKDKLAFKVNVAYVKADDWRAQDGSNYDRTNMQLKPGDRSTDPAYDGINVYGDEIKANMRNVANAVIATGRNTFIEQYQNATGTLPTEPQILNFLSTNPTVSPFYLGLQAGFIPNQEVSRTGYAEQDLVDYNTEVLRTNASFNYKIGEKTEAIAQAYWGTGTSVYTGADRYSLSNFKMGQYKLELKGEKFFLRGYTTQERSGGAYNATALASYINEQSKPSTSWFPQYVGNYLLARSQGQSEETAHLTARSMADDGRFEPGSEEFNQAKEDIASRTIGTQGGARFEDRTNLWHYEGMYNFSGLIPQTDIITGASYRLYALNSGGTIFNDLNKKLNYAEYGAYMQATRKFREDRFKATASLRYDKNENFKGFLSPRISGVWKVVNGHYLRVSYLSGFRNPTAQNQYIDFLTGVNTRLIGALPEILDKYELRTNQPYTNESYRAYAQSGNPADLETFNFRRFRPEKIRTYEIGYRALLKKNLHLDAYYYLNNYRDFITGAVLWQNPVPGNPAGMMSPMRYETVVNSASPVRTQGWALGIDYTLRKFKFMGNVAHDRISELPEELFNNFNTPPYKFNIGVGANEIAKNTSFNVMYRWQDQYTWRSIFAVGDVPAFGALDAQVSFRLPVHQSVLKIGGANLLNKYYRTSIGNPAIGGMYYVSLVFDSSVLVRD